MTKRDIVIVGGGMAGMAACIHVTAPECMSVTLLERNRTLGRKILVSGSGQCNITHGGDIRGFADHYGTKGGFLRHALFSYPNTYLLDFFEKRGLVFVEDGNGKVFPESRRAIDIRDCLLDACVSRGSAIRTDSRVRKVRRDDGAFVVHTDSSELHADALVIATGGASYPSTGSTGDGYGIAESLGHTIVPPRPALTPVYSEKFTLASLSGLTFEEIRVTQRRDGKKVGDYTGSLLITHAGLSGPVILDNSRYIREGDTLGIAFVEEKAARDLSSALVERASGQGGLLVKTLVTRFGCPKRLAETLAAAAGIQDDTTISGLGREERKLLVRLIGEFPVPVTGLGGFEEAFTTSGGVDTSEIDPKTMGSRIVKNLFFAGEVMDYDGDTGGYGLQAAFSTGALCGSSSSKAIA